LPSAQLGSQRLSQRDPRPAAAVDVQADQVRCSTPRPASAQVMMMEAGLSDSACGGAVVQLATTPGKWFPLADAAPADPEVADPVLADAALAGEGVLATGAGELATGETVAAGDAGGLVRVGEAGAAGRCVFATAVAEVPLAALVPGVAQAETVRASPASAQAANALCGDSKVSISSTTTGAREGL
jgi:hypothetical protein